MFPNAVTIEKLAKKLKALEAQNAALRVRLTNSRRQLDASQARSRSACARVIR